MTMYAILPNDTVPPIARPRRRSFPGLVLLGALAAFAAHAAGTDPALQKDRQRAAALVAKMTLAEKIAQLQNAAPAIPRLHVPAYNWWSEGLHGFARDGVATVFPQSMGLAATWDTDLLHAVGTTVSTEARAKFNALGRHGAHGVFQGLSVWSPNINILRDPRWGRGQETYGEDPYLTGRLATAFVRGVQGDDPRYLRAIATPKHFAVHNGPEPGRHGFDVDVSPHDLEATYLPAFRAAVVDGHAASVMCAYNALHGTPACADAALLQGRLRKDWGFDGYVVSDCDAVDDMTHFHYYRPDDAGSSAAAVAAGTDLNCGTAYASLEKAVHDGRVPVATIDRAVRRLFTARYRLGILGKDPGNPYDRIGPGAINTPADRNLALRAAYESIVLLKNARHVLPLAAGTHVAVIGPNADTVETLEANYHGTAADPVTPLRGMRTQFGAAHVTYAQGSPVVEGVPVPVPETALRSGPGAYAGAGLKAEYFDNTDFHGSPAVTRIDRRVDFDWDRTAPAAGLSADHYAVRWTGELVPPGPGDYTLAVHVDRCFDCRGHDPVKLFLDGKAVIADNGNGAHMQVHLHFDDTRPHRLRLEMRHTGQDQGIRLQWLAPVAAQLARAQHAAKAADVVVAFVGLSPDVEGEQLDVQVPGFDGGDRTDIGLPPVQRRLLHRLVATGKPLVVVLMSGDSVAMDWAKKHAAAILAAWYPGESGGTAIARTLAGANNPSGHLPVTFYRSTRDLPPYVDYSMQGRTYRYFKGTPLYPFGYGLSYTRFAYAAPEQSTTTLQAGRPLTVSADVRNSGKRAGDTVVQVYLDYPPSPLAPRHTLVGFRRVHLAAGERRRVRFTLDPRRLSSVDASGTRAVVPGDYRLFIGNGQPGDADGVHLRVHVDGRKVLAP